MPVDEFKEWVKASGETWPRPNFAALQASVLGHMNDLYPLDPSKTNFEALYQDRIYWGNNPSVPGGTETKFLTIGVTLNAESRGPYSDGLELAKHWDDFADEWNSKAPSFIRGSVFYTDKGAIHYFKLQETITNECFQGIAISLSLAYVVLLLATRNFILATIAIANIGSIVCSVIAFAHWNGWKLGLVESVIFVMIIGMSVDYVVHMADAFLEATANDREGRTQFMLGKMGMSVLSGAVTTLGSSSIMCATYITFFFKFGAMILWTIAQSVLTALVFFTAICALVGPNDDFGTIPMGWLKKLIKTRS